MIMPFCGFHYHVIDIDLQIPPYPVGEYDLHELMVCGANILEVE